MPPTFLSSVLRPNSFENTPIIRYLWFIQIKITCKSTIKLQYIKIDGVFFDVNHFFTTFLVFFYTLLNKNNYLCRTSQQNIQASLMLCIRFAVSLQKIRCISAKHSSKLDVVHSICCIFAKQKREQTIPQVRGENNLITKKWKETKVIYWSKELSL